MKSIILVTIILLGGYNMLQASTVGENPTKSTKQAVVFVLENKLGLLKLTCEDPDATIQIVNNNDKVVLEQPFNNQPLELDLREWEEGSYQYKIVAKKTLIKQGILQIRN